MDILPGAGAFLTLAVTLVVARFIRRGELPSTGATPTYATLEGLRGWLAAFVFVCHAQAWYDVAHHRGWGSETRLFMHFGQSSVALFFMITAFLFVGRLVDARDGSVDWLRLYVSRVLRLTPAYWLAMAAMFALVAIVTWAGIDGAGSAVVLRDWSDIGSAAGIWLGFCMLGEPTIDAYMNTPLIVAGVVWSMRFEWTFYCALPLIALLFRSRMRLPMGALLLGLASLLWMFLWRGQPDPVFATPFLGGAAAVFAVRSPVFVRFAGTKAGAVVALACLVALVTACQSPYGLAPLLLQTIAFALVAGGSDLLGLLSSRGARTLGALSYGIYLLHGIVLYTTFMVLIGMPRAQTLSPLAHWAIVLAVVPVLLLLAQACHRWIELPSMRAVGPSVRALRSIGGRSPVDATRPLRDAG